MTHRITDSPLGRAVTGSRQLDPGLLFPIARAHGREQLGFGSVLPFEGVDIWNAYELSWLDPRGKPVVAIAEFRVPASTPNLIESKSFKLYLNSLNQTRFSDPAAVRDRIADDLSAAAGARIGVSMAEVDQPLASMQGAFAGECIDGLPVAIDCYGPPQVQELAVRSGESLVEETLVSHLLKSNCPVTGQPDWASVQIAYAGAPIDREGLLRYLVSYRDHDDFHEQCVERIFRDLLARCAPTRLTVSARYTRRGGLDINPWRSNDPQRRADNPRLLRQ
ncbi:NADPH-dependent 7-cyano-7-deazaguanine reductase QueF [Dokdonella immobilis]|uniref:NADPH-dependent 7-cyano-7-deazaguanine reductase n=1 Tax=Dokdonella immobilis TaxID=578942 RepID=A0A1I4XVZ3_9GAMM|nr:NADPH-dependent 7-cyano-7-deazaguanine reductase QueF [Dokdonella immobilis]SFN29543.1 7-cyano-7-deazaguanine reductase [Dokdonella immobilis]